MKYRMLLILMLVPAIASAADFVLSTSAGTNSTLSACKGKLV
jgi:hypothetical protein